MRIRKALIIYKENVGRSHANAYETHYSSLKFVESSLRKAGIAYKKLPRGSFFKEDGFDIVFSVGGDGTFLDAARHVRKKPLLGLNSDAHHSVGRFCAAFATQFLHVLSRLEKDRFQICKVDRMQIYLNGKAFRTPILNDILLCHTSPAAMNHYVLKLKGHSERQRSSGIWVSTAAGSSAAIQSAGGKALPFGSSKFEYKPRELFEGHGVRYKLRGGAFNPSARLTVISQMEEAIIFMDGPHHHLRVHYGDTVRVTRSKHPLPAIYF